MELTVSCEDHTAARKAAAAPLENPRIPSYPLPLDQAVSRAYKEGGGGYTCVANGRL